MDELKGTRRCLFNLITTLRDELGLDFKDQTFKNMICREAGMQEKFYNELIKEWWGE